VEPAAERIVGLEPHHVGLASKYEEYRLEGVVSRVPVAGHTAADTQHHRPVSVHQGRERGLGRGVGSAPGKSVQELGVGQGSNRSLGEQHPPMIAADLRVR
jgi:hypothetical protein